MNHIWAASLFSALAGILLGFTTLCAYEAYAIASGNDPTISRIVAYTFAASPHAYIIGIFVAGAIFGALVTHFTNWSAV